MLIDLPPYDPNSLRPEKQYAYAFEISGVNDYVRTPVLNIKYFDLLFTLDFNLFISLIFSFILIAKLAGIIFFIELRGTKKASEFKSLCKILLLGL